MNLRKHNFLLQNFEPSDVLSRLSKSKETGIRLPFERVNHAKAKKPLADTPEKKKLNKIPAKFDCQIKCEKFSFVMKHLWQKLFRRRNVLPCPIHSS